MAPHVSRNKSKNVQLKTSTVKQGIPWSRACGMDLGTRLILKQAELFNCAKYSIPLFFVILSALSVNNFSSDVKDGENYTILLNQLAPDLCSKAPLRENDLLTRAEQILQNAEKLNCRKYLSPQSLVAGNPKLNLAFVANLFNTHPGLDPLEEVERPELPDVEGDREARGKKRREDMTA